MKKRTGIAAVLSYAVCFSGGDIASATTSVGSTGSGEPNSQSKRVKKDFGDASMLLGDVDWKGTSARASVKGKTGTLKIEAKRRDGPLRNAVHQSLQLYLPEFDGPGTYTARRGSMFLVVGVEMGAESDTGMDAAVMETLSKAKHLQLEGAEVVVESAGDTEVVGSFSFDRGRTPVTSGRFRARFREK